MLALMLAPLRGITLAQPANRSSGPAALQYLSPEPNSPFVPPATTLALRLNGPIDPASLSATLFSAWGSLSGLHTGSLRLAADGRTIVFKPNTPFTRGEHVLVTVQPGLTTLSGALFAGLQDSFNISASHLDAAALNASLDAEDESSAAPAPSAPPAPDALAFQPQDFVTMPSNFPAYTVTVPPSGTAPGLIFLAPINQTPVDNFLLITQDNGQPVYWKQGIQGYDFKRQADGSLTYFDQTDASFHVLNSSLHETRVISAANGYSADEHELQILPNGDAIFIINDFQITNTLALGGVETATVVGLVIQEQDPSGLPIFQWDSWTHFAISDTYVSYTATRVDYVHANALELDPTDGNLLLSSRHMSEITKIDHSDGPTAGNIIWRLGGKNNEFTIHDPSGPFSFQHDIRRLANGDLTMFDNHNPDGPSRALEYQIDETNKVVTNTWQFINSPPQFGGFTGNNQRLPDGQRLIDWGFSHPNITEVLTDGTKIFEMNLALPYFTYRAFRFPWTAVPEWAPTLVLTDANTPALYYSWNGATDVAAYDIYGGVGSTPNVLLRHQARTGFEDHTALSDLPAGYCAFRVQPLDQTNHPQTFSNVVYSLPYCPALRLPLFFR
jgi:hypothetical protein